MNTSPDNYIARYWEQLEGERIVCNLCPRRCQLKNSQRGFCFVRQNINGKLILTTYGRSSGFSVDPIEKKPLNHFYPGTKVLSFGTAGCNLGCQFCQNWDLSRSKKFERMTETAAPKAIAEAAKKGGTKSVAFTYNDPVIFAEYAIDTAIECQALGIKTVAVTAGYINNAARKDFFAHIDAANVDLKSFSEDFYQRLCKGHLQPVLDTLIYLKKQTDVWLEITNLLIPGENDSPDEIDQMTKWIKSNLGKDVPLHFSAFHPDYKLTDHPATAPKILLQARTIAQTNGLSYVYTGNVHDKKGGSTYCSNCEKVLIERDWFNIGEYNLTNTNHCRFCDTVCSGVFDPQV